MALLTRYKSLAILIITGLSIVTVIYYKHEIRNEVYALIILPLIGFIAYKTGYDTAMNVRRKKMTSVKGHNRWNPRITTNLPIRESCTYIVDQVLRRSKEFQLERKDVQHLLSGRALIQELPFLPGGLFLGIDYTDVTGN